MFYTLGGLGWLLDPLKLSTRWKQTQDSRMLAHMKEGIDAYWFLIVLMFYSETMLYLGPLCYKCVIFVLADSLNPIKIWFKDTLPGKMPRVCWKIPSKSFRSLILSFHRPNPCSSPKMPLVTFKGYNFSYYTLPFTSLGTLTFELFSRASMPRCTLIP